MNIALCHFRAGEPDGVSLEMEKWKLILEKIGHKVVILAGSLGSLSDGYTIPELLYTDPTNLLIAKNTYAPLIDFNSETEYRTVIYKFANQIKQQLLDFISKYKIDVLVPNNFWSIGGGLSAAIAFYDVINETGIKCIPHHHDFYWESCRSSYRSCKTAKEILDKYFPPADISNEQVKHVVINKISQREMKYYKNLNSTVVPNVFNFDAPLWTKDEYNSDFRQSLGIRENDILVLQATRIVTRKAIEMAVETVGELGSDRNLKLLYNSNLYNGCKFNENNKIYLVLAGKQEADETYFNLLKQKANECNVNIIFAGDIVEHSRIVKNGVKHYSLWDTYVYADIVTYTSIQEGWGNQLLETVFAKLPFVIFEYPVFVSDIKSKGFDVISLGDAYKLDENDLASVDKYKIIKAVEQIIIMLTDSNKRKLAVEHNFNICKKYFSYNTLETMLNRIFNFN